MTRRRARACRCSSGCPGRDRPSLTRDLLQLLGGAGAVLEDMEQLVVRERLTLDVLVRLDGADDGVVRDVLFWGFTHGLTGRLRAGRGHARAGPG